MKKSIFLFFAAILCAMSVQGANTMRIYCKQAQSWWKADNAAVGAYYWGTGGNANSWPGTRMTKVSGQTDLWYIDVDIDKYQNIIFTRVNGSGSVSDWGAKTNDLTIGNTKNQYTITQSSGAWDGAKSAGTWGTYKPTSTAALATSAANIFVGGQATLTSSLTSNTSANTIKGTAYAISPEGANVSGNTFTATAEGTYTVTATVTYYPLGCPTLTSTATATTTIKAEVPAEETHDVTVSYMCGKTKVADPTTVNTVGVEKSVKVTAPEIAKYAFVNWTLGADVTTEDALTNTAINITTKAGGSDFTLTANYEKAKLTYTVTVPAGTENCYLVGAMNGWDVDNPIEMTKQGENVFTVTLEGVATTDEYKYLSKKGSWDYADVQESNRTWTANDVVTAWKDPLATGLYLRGSMNGWGTTDHLKKATKDATTATVTIALEANTDYTFKVASSDWGEEYGKGSFTATATVKLTSKGENISLKTSAAGDYVFTWEMSTSKLTVTYPTLYAVTATANDAAMGTITGAGDYGKGSTATLTATPKDGYLFVNWTKGGEEVATTQEYSFKVTEAVALVANFEAAPEEVHNVTVSYVCGGNKIADDQTVAAVGETSAETVEAPAIFGYTFDSWKLGAGVTSADATANPISINIVAGAGDYTLTANYTEIPKVTIYVVNNTKWDKVYAYGWGGSVGENPAWPGADITANKEVEQIAGFDVHSYSVVPGSYVNIKFTNGSGTESNNFVWTNGKYYYMDAAANYAGGTKEEVTKVLTPTYTVAGDSEAAFGTTWDPTNTANDMALEGGLYKWTKTNVALYANTKISFKVVKNHDWNKGQWPERDGENDNNWILQEGITADGLYTITITFKEDDKTINATATKTGDIVTKDFSNQPAILYFHPSFHWTSDHAHFAAYFYNNGPGADAEPTWANMTDGDGDGVYEVANAKQHEYVIICRMNPDRTENNWEDEVMWNQIEHGITIPNTADDLNTCLAFWKNCQGDVPTSECTWVAPTPLTDKNWDAFIAAYNGKTINAVVERSFTSGQNHTLCLPFNLPTSWLGDGSKAYQLNSIFANTAEELQLNASECNTIEAGKPYIIVPVKGPEYEHIIVSGVIVEDVDAGTNVATGAGCKATLKAVTATDGTQTNGTTEYYVGANNGCLYKDVVDKLGLRAIIELTTTSGQPLPAHVRARVSNGENEATGFENITAPEGQTIKVISNGQLIIIRDGEMYNAQGVRF